MTIAQAQNLEEATRRVKNRSAWINSAIEAKINGSEMFSMSDISTSQIMAAFHVRICGDCPDGISCTKWIQLQNLVWENA